MNLALLLAIGGLIGWVSTKVDIESQRHKLTCAIGAGMTGSLLTGLLVAPLLSTDALTGSQMSASTLVLAPLGASLFVMLTHILERGVYGE